MFDTILETVIRLVCGVLMAIGLLAGGPAPQASTPPAHKTASSATYFSGTVTEIKPDSITVVRKLPAKDPVTRIFGMDAKTTVEGRIREKGRVTVRYAIEPDGTFRAVHIIVR